MKYDFRNIVIDKKIYTKLCLLMVANFIRNSSNEYVGYGERSCFKNYWKQVYVHTWPGEFARGLKVW